MHRAPAAKRLTVRSANTFEPAQSGETEASVTSKLARGTFAATFFLASLAAIEKESVSLVDI
jgi:hypothetical protein